MKSEAIQTRWDYKIIILLALWIVSFVPVYPDLVKTWVNDPDNSHGILVPLISLYFIWKKKERFSAPNTSYTIWGVIILAGSLGIYLLSLAGGIAVIQRSMIVVSLMGLILVTMGEEFFKSMMFPLFFLFFMVPIPASVLDIAAFPLQLLATSFSCSLIQFLSIPVYQEGNMLYFAHTQLEIAEACSGIRPVISFIMQGAVFAYLLPKSWSRRTMLVASAIPLALFANIIRVSGTGILAHFFGAKAARGFLHDFSGLAIFAFGFIAIYLEFMILKRGLKLSSQSDNSKMQS